MTGAHIALSIAALAAALAAALLGGWAWHTGAWSKPFWPVLRTAQVLVGLSALVGFVLYLGGERDYPALHVLYGCLPLAVAAIAEQLRVASAETVLEQRGLPDAQAVGALPELEQRLVVLAIVRRETGIEAFASAVVVVLLLRAAGWV